MDKLRLRTPLPSCDGPLWPRLRAVVAFAAGWARLALLAFAAMSGLPPAHAAGSEATSGASTAERVRTQWSERVRAIARQATATLDRPGVRVEIEVGSLDPRLQLAACADVQPYLPRGTRLWGKARIGLRCASGPVHWNVFLPVTVKVWAPALVAAGPLAGGSTLSSDDLRLAEVDIAAGSGVALTDAGEVVGRSLARPLAAAQPLRSTDLKSRQWFASGETVRLVAVGDGYSVAGEGLALSPGIEGRAVRVRTEGGRIVTGTAVGDRRVEVAL